ncbi:hypothetical protein VP1G_10633 [Cytospora mali]|uniref:Uncharacterized protein n=1 Tax=Cytospora mali TaxID=578113 RepID=A0A194USV8_CYTMA|nr:hypothetical protein VP1G_10633 [Valsa mali var. pyri (nom. inval.)]
METDTDEPDDGAGDDAQDVAVEEDAADEDVEGAAADEGEEEGGVAGDLGRDLELEEAGGCIFAFVSVEQEETGWALWGLE